MTNADQPKNLSFTKEVLPWFRGLFHGRLQNSDFRVSEICQELILALENRLILVYRSPLLKRNEVLVRPALRGQKILDEDTSNRLSFPPEIGCDDESLDKYFAVATQANMEDLVQMQAKSSALDEILDHFSMLDSY